MKKGEKFDFDKIYFRAVPKFEAPNDSKYDWMNNAVFIWKMFQIRIMHSSRYGKYSEMN